MVVLRCSIKEPDCSDRARVIVQCGDEVVVAAHVKHVDQTVATGLGRSRQSEQLDDRFVFACVCHARIIHADIVSTSWYLQCEDFL